MSSEKSPPRGVFDTNIYIAAFLTEGLCEKLFYRAVEGDIVLFISPYILEELKKKTQEKTSLSEAKESIELVKDVEIVVDPKKLGVTVQGISRDPEDDPVLAAALAAKADFLVSGDHDLLDLKTYQGIRIVSPREFEEVFLPSLKEGRGLEPILTGEEGSAVRVRGSTRWV